MSKMESPKESFKKRYQIIKRISEGNFGCVYKALDAKTSFLYKSDEFVALSELEACEKFLRKVIAKAAT